MDEQEIRKTLNDILDPTGKGKKLANKITRLLLEAIEDEDDAFVWGPAMVAIAVLMCDPEVDKENAIANAKDFCGNVTEEITNYWDRFVDIRRNYSDGTIP